MTHLASRRSRGKERATGAARETSSVYFEDRPTSANETLRQAELLAGWRIFETRP